jgi:hypothetical protein
MQMETHLHRAIQQLSNRRGLPDAATHRLLSISSRLLQMCRRHITATPSPSDVAATALLAFESVLLQQADETVATDLSLGASYSAVKQTQYRRLVQTLAAACSRAGCAEILPLVDRYELALDVDECCDC